MSSNLYTDPRQLRDRLLELRKERKRRKEINGRRPRSQLSERNRQLVLEATDGRCHICGGDVGAQWQADHVLAHSGGGSNDHKNFLPAHALCNNYRWDYLPEEFQLILKLGVWARTEIEKGTRNGESIAASFSVKEANVKSRRVTRK
jgi:hypothetical protein